jgi:hypothetical protein
MVAASILMLVLLWACSSRDPELVSAGTGNGTTGNGTTGNGTTGNGTESAPANGASGAPICTGGEAIRFQYGMEAVGAGHSALLTRNGSSYLRVDGNCNYWALRGSDRDAIRRGVLSAREAAELASEVHYTQWQLWYGRHGYASVSDAVPMVFGDPHGEFACSDGCRSPAPSDVDPAWQVEVRPIFEVADDWLTRKYEEGAPVSGPVRVIGRVSALDRRYWLPEALSAWTLAQPLDDVVFPEYAEAGSELPFPIGGVLLGGSDAERLRELRLQAQARYERNGFLGGFIGIDDGERIIELLIADVLPQEDENGIVPRPLGD